jgi:ATP-dependent RNA helicase DDX41
LLLDLKHLLIEAKQRIPPVLSTIVVPGDDDAQAEVDGVKGCQFCGGLGHRVSNCPKMEQQRMKQMMGAEDRDFLAGDSRHGGRGEVRYGGDE